MGEVIRAALPYLLFGVLLLALIFFVPTVATWLPSRV
jgi:TRAP-type C4-dicarboxylate transport system permease large subunit